MRKGENESASRAGGPDDAARAAALKRTKRLATGALALAIVAMILFKVLERQFAGSAPAVLALGYLAAFAEAAVIGGLADWYAVVALFKHPLGIPIPHTAIVPANQQRIADNLGKFIEAQFLAPEPVAAKLGDVDFAALVAEWMADGERSGALANFVLRLLPQTIDAIDRTGLREFLTRRITEEINSVELAPLAADILSSFIRDGRHQQILNELLGALHRLLADADAVNGIREKIRDELPALFNLFRADAFILRKLLNSAFQFIEDVRANPAHPLRDEFDGFVMRFIGSLRDQPDYAERADKLKRDLLERPELRGLGQKLWNGLKTMVEQDAASQNSAIRAHLQGMFVSIGRQLASDKQVRASMNHGFVVALQAFVQSQKSHVSKFIADQVKAWDMGQLVRVIELNIGRDLQYIRFNGMIIGGLAGVALHGVKHLLGSP